MEDSQYACVCLPFLAGGASWQGTQLQGGWRTAPWRSGPAWLAYERHANPVCGGGRAALLENRRLGGCYRSLAERTGGARTRSGGGVAAVSRDESHDGGDAERNGSYGNEAALSCRSRWCAAARRALLLRGRSGILRPWRHLWRCRRRFSGQSGALQRVLPDRD